MFNPRDAADPVRQRPALSRRRYALAPRSDGGGGGEPGPLHHSPCTSDPRRRSRLQDRALRSAECRRHGADARSACRRRPVPGAIGLAATRAAGGRGGVAIGLALSDVLVLGDSFSNIYALESMAWGTSAGLVEQLSYLLRRPVDRIVQNDDGAFATRAMLQQNPQRLDGKKSSSTSSRSASWRSETGSCSTCLPDDRQPEATAAALVNRGSGTCDRQGLTLGTSATRRFRRRVSSLVLSCLDWSSPRLIVCSRSAAIPWLIRYSLTALARRAPSARL